MVKLIRVLVAMIVTMFAIPAMAFNPPPAPTVGSIVDQAGVLSPMEIRNLNMQLRQVNQGTTNQIGILIIPSPGGENMRDIGYATAKAWKVGQAGIDNGVMIVWARHNDTGGPGQVTIETGKGVEGDLPDLKCNDIIANVIRPQFKNKQFAAGLSQGITAINTAIGDHRAALAAQQKQDALLHPNNTVPVGTTPQTSTSHGCDVSGAPVQQAGFGGVVLGMVLLLLGVGVFRHWYRKLVAQSELRAEAERKVYENTRLATEALRAATKQQEDRLREQERQNQTLRAAIAQVRAPNTAVPLPVATATVDTATAAVAERIRQQQADELARQQRLEQKIEEQRQEAVRQRQAAYERQAAADEAARQERLARQEREQREADLAEEHRQAAVAASLAATAALIDNDSFDSGSGGSGSACSSSSSCSSSSDNPSSNDDSPSSCSGGSSCSSSSGGGDVGGGGSDGGACSS